MIAYTLTIRRQDRPPVQVADSLEVERGKRIPKVSLARRRAELLVEGRRKYLVDVAPLEPSTMLARI